MYRIGQKVMHPLYGIGTVEKIEEKNLLGKSGKFSVISFQGDRLKMMINMDQKSNLIRNLISKEEVPKVLRFLKECKSAFPPKSSERYNINLKKIKSANIYQLAEVIKDLTYLSKEKRLSPKEMNMLRQSKKMLSTEFSYVTSMPQEEAESIIEQICQVE